MLIQILFCWVCVYIYIYINRYVQVIKYWFKVISSENIIVKSVYDNSILNNVRGDSWPFKVKLLLESYGFSDVWLNPEQFYVPTFISSFKQRVTDAFYQEWFADLFNNNVLNIFYVNLKLTFVFISNLLFVRARVCVCVINLHIEYSL